MLALFVVALICFAAPQDAALLHHSNAGAEQQPPLASHAGGLAGSVQASEEAHVSALEMQNSELKQGIQEIDDVLADAQPQETATVSAMETEVVQSNQGGTQTDTEVVNNQVKLIDQVDSGVSPFHSGGLSGSVQASEEAQVSALEMHNAELKYAVQEINDVLADAQPEEKATGSAMESEVLHSKEGVTQKETDVVNAQLELTDQVDSVASADHSGGMSGSVQSNEEVQVSALEMHNAELKNAVQEIDDVLADAQQGDTQKEMEVVNDQVELSNHMDSGASALEVQNVHLKHTLQEIGDLLADAQPEEKATGSAKEMEVQLKQTIQEVHDLLSDAYGAE